MANLKLGSSDVKQLLATYEGKQRQLRFEMDRVKATIKNLKNSLTELEKIEEEQAAMLAAGEEEMPDFSAAEMAESADRPKALRTRKKAQRKLAGPKTKTEEKKDRSSGYRLSEYDQLLFDVLRAHDRAMINSELVEHVEALKKERGETVVEGEAQTMIVRSLQKLANRRDDILKVPYEGRGMAYALPEWVSAQGVIKKKHAHKG